MQRYGVGRLERSGGRQHVGREEGRQEQQHNNVNELQSGGRRTKGRLLASALVLVPVRTVVAVLVGNNECHTLFAVRTHELRADGRVSQTNYRRMVMTRRESAERTAYLFAAAVGARSSMVCTVYTASAAAVDLGDLACLKGVAEVSICVAITGNEEYAR